MKIICVGGQFDKHNGKASGYFQKLCDTTLSILKPEKQTIINGGNIKAIDNILQQIPDYTIVLWMPNISNDLDTKYINNIKTHNQHICLIASKVNNNRYNIQELLQRMLATKTNLLLELNTSEKVSARILDPLGNLYADSDNIDIISTTLASRIILLSQITRQQSKCIGDITNYTEPPAGFIKLINHYGESFHNLIHGHNPQRYLGNASFRCTRGFPSYRRNNLIYVSRRNVDKRTISKDDFVPINPQSQILKPCWLEYYGPHKPSVDAPIQRKLYNRYHNINYIIHGHTYIKDEPMTKTALPCGCEQEFSAITQIAQNLDANRIIVNLRGHGFIAMADNYNKLENLDLIARRIPSDPMII